MEHWSPLRPAGVGRPARRAVALVQRAGFWTAIALPLVYLLLIAFGRFVPSLPAVLVGAVALNVVALVVGHGYEPRIARESSDG